MGRFQGSFTFRPSIMAATPHQMLNIVATLSVPSLLPLELLVKRLVELPAIRPDIVADNRTIKLFSDIIFLS